ncbi:MAG: YciI family protein [Anaeromyxobacteraceae bacterium]
MYAIAIIRYRKPLEDVLKIVDEHRAYLGALKSKGILLVSGPLDPRYGGALLLRLPDGSADAALLAVRDGDPFVKHGVAQYELLPWAPNIGKEDIDRL